MRGPQAASDVVEHAGAYQLRAVALLTLAARLAATGGGERSWTAGVAIAIAVTLGQREGARMFDFPAADWTFGVVTVLVAAAWLWASFRTAAARGAVAVALIWLAAVLSGMMAHALLGSYAAVQRSGLFGAQLVLVAAVFVLLNLRSRPGLRS